MAEQQALLGTIKITDQEFRTMTSYIKQKYGINLTEKRVLIEGRMTNMLRERGLTSFSQYMEILMKDQSGNEAINMLNRLTTNHSFFMREIEHFDFLRTVVLPALVKVHSADRCLRIWSAGCSAGQEAYTTVMVMNEFFGAQASQWDTRILATDISRKAMDRAIKGVYTPDETKDVPARWRTKYFTTLPNGDLQISQAVRNQVIFRPMNLMEPFTAIKRPMDLIFCRNVMIYFDAPTKDRLVKKFYDATADGGYFFIGHSESINRNASPYRYIQPAIYQRGGKV